MEGLSEELLGHRYTRQELEKHAIIKDTYKAKVSALRRVRPVRNATKLKKKLDAKSELRQRVKPRCGSPHRKWPPAPKAAESACHPSSSSQVRAVEMP